MLKLTGFALLLLLIFWSTIAVGNIEQPLTRPMKFFMRGMFTVSLLFMFYGVWYDC